MRILAIVPVTLALIVAAKAVAAVNPAASTPFIVVDRKGTVVGSVVGSTIGDGTSGLYGVGEILVVRQVSSGFWIELPVIAAGIINNATTGNIPSTGQLQFAYIYTSAHCTGMPYLSAAAMPVLGYWLPDNPNVAASGTGTLAYPNPANLQVLQISSYRQYLSGESLCGNIPTPVPTLAGKEKQQHFSFTPPFKLVPVGGQ